MVQNNIFLFKRIKLDSLYTWETRKVVSNFFCFGIMLSYLVSMNPWFAWKLTSAWYLVGSISLFFSMMLSHGISKPIYTHTFMLPWFSVIALLYYSIWALQLPFSTYIGTLFHVVIFLSIFRSDKELYFELSTKISKMMAIILLPSMVFFLLFLTGVPLPHSNISHPSGDYNFTNYYFFLLDDRSAWEIIPRFHSIVLEPGHLGSATSILLISQCGRLKKWHNIILFVVTFITFSLAAYVLFFIGTFLIQWMMHRTVKKWIIGTILVSLLTTAIATNYNQGDNMVNNLIVLRLQMNEDGKLEGDNRVSDSFMKDYESIWNSSDIVFGRGSLIIEDNHGNSGYKRYIYEKGLLGVLLALCFFFFSLMPSKDKRALFSAAIIAILLFVVRADVTSYYDFLGVYMIAYRFG